MSDETKPGRALPSKSADQNTQLMRLPLNEDMDANRWVAEFKQRIRVMTHDEVSDVDFLRAWFANAIMCGYDNGVWKTRNDSSLEQALRLCKKAMLASLSGAHTKEQWDEALSSARWALSTRSAEKGNHEHSTLDSDNQRAPMPGLGSGDAIRSDAGSVIGDSRRSSEVTTTDLSVLQALDGALAVAKRYHDDCCKESCRPIDHFDWCIREGLQLDGFRKTLRSARAVEQEERPSDGKTEAQLRDFYDEWSAKDGNSPGYNIQKAKTYGTYAAHYKQVLERIIAAGPTYGDAAKKTIKMAQDALDWKPELKDVLVKETEVARTALPKDDE